MRQRQTWDLRHHHRLRPILRHPDRQLRQGAVGLTDGHSDIVTTAIATGYDDRLPVTGMKSVTDNRLTQLIVSIMKLSRRHRGPSSTGDQWSTLRATWRPVSEGATLTSSLNEL